MRTQQRRFFPVWLLTFALAACDPSWSLAFRQRIAPATLQSCIANVLRADARVDTVFGTPDGDLGFALRDSALHQRRRSGWVTVEKARKDTVDTLRTLEIAVLWRFPAAGVSADSARTRQLVSFGREVTEQVRRTCTPSVPSAVSCRVTGAPLRPGGGCEPAA